jgi:hypothetical protein
MKEFEPSRDFVRKVMQGVRACEAGKSDQAMTAERMLSSRLVRITLSTGGALIGIINLIRIPLIFLSPALCR